MGVYIKGMEMPKNCIECHITKPYSCWIVGIIFSSEDESWIYKKRPNWCPLVEIPTPHGKLIDADKFKSDNPLHIELDVPYVTETTVEDKIDYAPIVIEAEE